MKYKTYNFKNILKMYDFYKVVDLLNWMNKLARKESKALNLSNANLSNIKLRCVDLCNVNLENANLSNTDLRKSNLHNTNLSGACLCDINLYDAYLSKTDLEGADLSGAYLYDSDLCCANLHNIKGKDIISISGIGSEKRQTIYNITDDYIQCGCYFDTFLRFIDRIKRVYAKDDLYYKQYKLAVIYFYKQRNLLRS